MHRNKYKKANNTMYLSKENIMKELRLYETDFETLCILKGVHPVVPKNIGSALKGNQGGKVFYTKKSLEYLSEGPFIKIILDKKFALKKVKKAISLGDNVRLASTKCILEEIIRRERICVDKIIQQRYGTFENSLDSLGDALSFLFMLSKMNPYKKINEEEIQKCKDLTKTFLQIISSSGLIKAGFISVKGFYLSAQIGNKDVVWKMPHSFTSNVPGFADTNTLSSFVLLYTRLVHLVNYKLELLHSKKENNKQNIFSNLKILIEREVCFEYISKIIESLGGIALSSFLEKDDDKEITHVIVDRPSLNTIIQGRKYVQPQWVFDCLNSKKKLNEEEYAPGIELPFHLSPFKEEKLSLVKTKSGSKIIDQHGHILKTEREMQGDIKYETENKDEHELSVMDERNRKIYKKLKYKNRLEKKN